MVTDVIVLDVQHVRYAYPLPPSARFELLRCLHPATLKMMSDDSLNYGMLLNSNKALE